MSGAVPVREPGSNPIDYPDTSDGLARRINQEAGPVSSRQMTPEESARYAPQRPTKADLEEAIEQGLSQFEVAARFETTLEHVKQVAGMHGLTFSFRELPERNYLVKLINEHPRRQVLAAMLKHPNAEAAAKALGLSKDYWWHLTRVYRLNIRLVRKEAGLKAPPGSEIHPLPARIAVAADTPHEPAAPPAPAADAATLGESLRRIARALRDNDHGDLTADELDLLNIIAVLASQAVERRTAAPKTAPEPPNVACETASILVDITSQDELTDDEHIILDGLKLVVDDRLNERHLPDIDRRLAEIRADLARLEVEVAGHNHQFQGAWTGPAEAPRRSMRNVG